MGKQNCAMRRGKGEVEKKEETISSVLGGPEGRHQQRHRLRRGPVSFSFFGRHFGSPPHASEKVLRRCGFPFVVCIECMRQALIT